jgi:hypothetical protein
VVFLVAVLGAPAQALPLFARQTGQNCQACHAGGQFPELTAYGRMFKLTGYTLGERTVPLAAMVVASRSSVANTSKSADPAADFQKNNEAFVATASLFLGGKITDRIGAFTQITYDPYAAQDASGQFHGHSSVDNIDVRYADRFVSPDRDLIVGVSLNNNPSVSDPWNTAAAWMQYVPVPSPTSSRFVDGAAPYPGYGAAAPLAGVTAYAFWNRTIYAELGGYRSARGALRFMSAGVAPEELTRINGLSPYWRFAFNREWGPHSLMVGTSGMRSRFYDDPLDTSSPLHRTRDLILDAQYQYLLDPHSVTVQLVHERSRIDDDDMTHLWRAKSTYVYNAKYGASAGFFDLTGNTNPANQVANPVDGNIAGNPGTRGYTLEAFWMPVQYLRVGVQYTGYTRFNGASRNYDGFGRDAKDNNTLFLYLWGAY